LVHGDRGADYGTPLSNFSHTAALWSAAFGHPFTPEQVAIAMILVKVSRECHKHKRDTVVDIAGYAETLQMVIDEKRAGVGYSDWPKQSIK
jgi:hypothetical protein